MRRRHDKNQGFTLIELTIVLVIIGLIIGGILVGQDMIAAAATRAQIAQIEKFRTAINTFRVKFGYLPGDIPDPYASQFGFQARGQYAGEGDGNGVIDGVTANAAMSSVGTAEATGEIAVAWSDLSTARFIPGSFTKASTTVLPTYNVTTTTAPIKISDLLPPAQISQGTYIYIYEAGEYGAPVNWVGTGLNYFGVAQVTGIKALSNSSKLSSNPAFTVSQAYSIDTKIDDGLPETGSVTADWLDGDLVWADGSNGNFSPPSTAATPGSPTTCYDNGNVAGQQHYSMEQNNGAYVNCALSFRFE